MTESCFTVKINYYISKNSYPFSKLQLLAEPMVNLFWRKASNY